MYLPGPLRVGSTWSTPGWAGIHMNGENVVGKRNGTCYYRPGALSSKTTHITRSTSLALRELSTDIIEAF